MSGSNRDHLAPGLRVLFHRNYAAYYKISSGEVMIVRVLHGARDRDDIAKGEGF